ncbi:3-deoxy-manno-octulosonate cytidylyltransferase [Lamprobacter modestohalophilus]|uniref:3-deoxy-manno-octulosonate cytidylyltransferase n=1 Tax=Lamprobacter modestohalophilus TaxID=1064514 RepID=UPI002ADEC1D9|nr:3-deoxy-manno-octulosonate cytidylyltransferase [Lamprobacter modestohalophilus]MEA1051040.1 3-deoxy-manno-octulosonate cytidylyltransferase [Lamprobacter modestohalophilus]
MSRDTVEQPFRVVIPARFGATRLPGKPLIEIGGRPLIAWVWERACASSATEVLIATDHPRIAEACSAFGAEVVMTRADHRSGSERIAEVAEIRGWDAVDIVVNLQGDEPGISPVLIDQVARGLAHHPDAGLSTLACRIEDAASLFDPHVVKVLIDCNGYALYFSRAPVPWHRDEFLRDQTQLPRGVPFLRHIGLYAYHAGFLASYVSWSASPLEQAESLEQLRVLWHGGRIHVSEAKTLPGPGVDTPDDVQRVARWLEANEEGRRGPEQA